MRIRKKGMGIKSLKVFVSVILIVGFSFQSIASVCHLARCGNQAVMMDCCKTKADQTSQYKEACCSLENSESSIPFSQTSISSSETFQIRTIQIASLTTLPTLNLSLSFIERNKTTGEPSAFRSAILRI